MNQKIKKWREEANMLGDEMEGYAKNYRCEKCDEFYCSHMLKARTQKFKKRCDKEMGKLLLIASG